MVRGSGRKVETRGGRRLNHAIEAARNVRTGMARGRQNASRHDRRQPPNRSASSPRPPALSSGGTARAQVARKA